MSANQLTVAYLVAGVLFVLSLLFGALMLGMQALWGGAYLGGDAAPAAAAA